MVVHENKPLTAASFAAAQAKMQEEIAKKNAPEPPAAAPTADAAPINDRAQQNLLFAVFYNKNNEVRRMLKSENAVPVDTQNPAKWSPLLTAAWHGCRTTVIMLLDEFSADIEMANESGWTPLLAAAMHGHAEVVKELICRGALLDAKATTGKTALDYAKEMVNHRAQPDDRHEARKEVIAILERAHAAIAAGAPAPSADEAEQAAEAGEDGDASMNDGKPRGPLEELRLGWSILPVYCLHYIISCPPSLQEEVVTIVQSGRALRLFHGGETEQARVGDEAWKTWRTTIANNVITALKALQDSKTRSARLIFVEDKGSKLAKEEWSEWPSLRKTLDFMIKNANKERDAVGGLQPISIELHGDGPMAVDEIRATFGSGNAKHSLRSVGIAASAMGAFTKAGAAAVVEAS